MTHVSGPGVDDVCITADSRLFPSVPKNSASPETFWLRKIVKGKCPGLAACQPAISPRQLEKLKQEEPKSTSGSWRTWMQPHADVNPHKSKQNGSGVEHPHALHKKRRKNPPLVNYLMLTVFVTGVYMWHNVWPKWFTPNWWNKVTSATLHAQLSCKGLFAFACRTHMCSTCKSLHCTARYGAITYNQACMLHTIKLACS